ncbi:putative PLAT/LH2 domain-containing protein [Plasmopara halstedii]
MLSSMSSRETLYFSCSEWLMAFALSRNYRHYNRMEGSYHVLRRGSDNEKYAVSISSVNVYY